MGGSLANDEVVFDFTQPSKSSHWPASIADYRDKLVVLAIMPMIKIIYRGRHQGMTERMPRATRSPGAPGSRRQHPAPPGHGANTRRTQDSRACTAVRDTVAVGTIVWNPWNPPAQM
jgi:hypothetical protein